MSAVYKTKSRSYLTSLQTQFLDNENNEISNQYGELFHSQLPEIIKLYNSKSNKYNEACARLGLSILGTIPKDILVTPDFIDFINFICYVLNQSLISEVLCDTLYLIPRIVEKNVNTVKFFEMNNINQTLFNLIQKKDNQIIYRVIECISRLVYGTDDLLKYEYVMHYDMLHSFADISPKIKNSVLSLCCSVLNTCQPLFIHRDEFITLGIELFTIEDDNDIEFISSLRHALKINPNPSDIFVLLKEQKFNGASFLDALSSWIDPNAQSSSSNIILQLFSTIIKYVNISASEKLSYIQSFQDKIMLTISNQTRKALPDPTSLSISYKILCYIISTNSSIIKFLFEKNIISYQIISNNLEKGDFCLRKAALKLTNTLMKFGSFFPEISTFYSAPYINIVSYFLHSDSNKIILLSLNSIFLITDRANKEGNKIVIEALQNPSIINILDELRNNDDDKISICAEQIFNIISKYFVQ